MNLKWTSKAVSDLVRLHEFLAAVNMLAAAQIVQALSVAPLRLLEQPRIGKKLEEYEPREVRRIIIGSYKLRYELKSQQSTCCVSGTLGKIDRMCD